MVDRGDIGSFTGFTLLQPQPPQETTIAPEQSSVVHFTFQVPRSVRDGAFICAQVFAGQGHSPFFNTVGQRNLFCIEKGFTGAFSIMPEEAAKQLRQQLEERSWIPSTQKKSQESALQHAR
jgi:hypothetical protein